MKGRECWWVLAELPVKALNVQTDIPNVMESGSMEALTLGAL